MLSRSRESGPIGLMCLKLLVGTGIQTIVAGLARDAARLEYARRIGAARVVNVEQEDVVHIVREAAGGAGAQSQLKRQGARPRSATAWRLFGPWAGSHRQVFFGREIEIP